ncbi:MAG: Bro-N domain-containing protein [Deltaproteobacteria bacterium]
MESNIAVFKGKEIRKTIHKSEWWFVVEDVVLALIESSDSKQYIQRMKQRDPELGKGWVQIVHTLLIDTSGGKQKMNCANTETMFRIIQSIPSPKAESFKRWLAKVGYERVQEIEDPELGTKRTRALYKAKGYSDPTANGRGYDSSPEVLRDRGKFRLIRPEPIPVFRGNQGHFPYFLTKCRRVDGDVGAKRNKV